jgi:predicted transcriptional regulator
MRTVVGVESFEGMVARKRARAASLSDGTPVRAERRVMFDCAEDLLACMTPQRIRLVRTVRDHPLSLTDLAAALQRDRKSVHRDVAALRDAGLVVLKRQVNPGHGIVQMVQARGKRLELRAEL